MAEKASRRLWSELTFTLDLASVGHRKAVSFRAPSKVYQPLIKTVMKIFPFYPAPMLSYSISQKYWIGWRVFKVQGVYVPSGLVNSLKVGNEMKVWDTECVGSRTQATSLA